MNNENEEFDLFATEVEDNLQETLAKGGYKWTNKYTAILGALVIITGAVSGGIWYGNGHSTASSAINGIASRIRGAAAGGAFTGAAGAAGGFGGTAGATAGAAGGLAGAAGGFGGGSRLSGTITKVNGTTVTITLDAAPATPIASGDVVSVRDTGAAGAAPAAPSAAGGAVAGTTGSSTTAGSKKSGAPAAGGATSTKPTVGGAGASGAPRAGGRFSNPAFTDCLAKAGVTLAPGARPDSTDPKVAAALQSCIGTLGGAPGAGAPGGGAAGGFSGGARPAPTATP